MIRECKSFPLVVQEPRDDAHRLRVATEIAELDPPRARLIEASIAACQATSRAIAECQLEPVAVKPLRAETRALLKQHGDRWRAQEDRVNGGVMRGFLEAIDVGPAPSLEVIRALDEWPVLHLAIRAPIAEMPEPVRRAIPRMVTLGLHDVDDAQVEQVLSAYDLSSLRKLTLFGKLSEHCLHALCTASLPMLEDFCIVPGSLMNPCDSAQPISWTLQTIWVMRSELGESLEARYGWKKYFHAASRMSEYQYPLEVLDILPPLPAHMEFQERLWHPG